jgi:putative hemin transport protein
MALTRNDNAVHEKIGVYSGYIPRERVSMFLGGAINLRLFRAHWVHGFAVEKIEGETVRRSLQFFDAHGYAVHKIHACPVTDIAAWDALVASLAMPADAIVPGFMPPVLRADVADPDEEQVAELRKRWASIEDTHDFQGMIARLGFKRLQAVRAVGDAYSWRLADDAMDAVFNLAAAERTDIMVFVRNPGCLQIHAGTVSNIKRTGDWLNVMDPDFHLHLRTSAIAECWLIKRPSKDGDVVSIEGYDANGDRIILINGYWTEGLASRPDWQKLVAELPRHTVASAA